MPRHNKVMSLGRILDDHESTTANSANSTSIAFHALVVNNDDPYRLKRIQVRIEGIDDNTTDNDLPWCISTIPDFFHSIPQIGECVIVMMMNPWNKSYARIYFGTLQLGESYSDTTKAFGFSKNDRNK